MKIINVTPGLIPIPPNGWGAVEKIIWEIHNCQLALGYESEIKYLDDIKPGNQIVHIHVANLAVMAHARGIPYYFTMHDHHAYLYGKSSPVYKENREAMEKSIASFVPAKFLVEYFDTPKVSYFSHGVNTKFFSEGYPNHIKYHSDILCVANNGFIHDQSEDRKGFSYAIEAAKKLSTSITIVGPKNNKNFFDKYGYFDYDKLRIVYDVPENELIEYYRGAHMFVHPSILEAGHPNLTLLEAMACGLPVIGTFEDNNSLEGMIKVERNVDQIVEAYNKIKNSQGLYQGLALKQAKELSWDNRTKELIKIYKKSYSRHMEQQLIDNYENTPIIKRDKINRKNELSFHFVNGAFVEITGDQNHEYEIQFYNKSNNKIEFKSNINNNCWCKCDIKYFVNWTIKVLNKTTRESKDIDINLKDQRVLISFDSKAIGDTLAWFPYVEEFRKKHQAKVIVSTFHNYLFKDLYPEIEFTEPGTTSHDLMAMYCIGWYYKDGDKIDDMKHPKDFKNQPLQKTATDILGLDYREIIPKYKSSKWKEWSIIRSNFNKRLKVPSITDKVFLDRDSKGFTIEKYREGKYESAHLVYNENFEAPNTPRGNIYEHGDCMIEEGDIVVDIGANIGCFSEFANRVGANEIYAYEPSSLAFSCLETNIQAPYFFGYRLLVSNSEQEKQKLYLDITSDVGNSMTPHGNTGDIFEEVETINLHKILRDTGGIIDFLKIDAEGAEKLILDTTPDEDFKNIIKIVLEFHTGVLGQQYKEQLVERLNKLGYNSFENINDDVSIIHFWKIDHKLTKPPVILKKKKTKKAAIAIHGTTQAKYWNNRYGWQNIVYRLLEDDYKVTLLSKEGNGFMGNTHPIGIEQFPEGPLDKLITELENSDMFIGIGSGLTWLAWMTGTPVVLISGFSEPYTETYINTYRIDAPKNACRGCFNREKLDAGDWNWCPDHKNTPRQFECSKLIQPDTVWEKIKEIKD